MTFHRPAIGAALMMLGALALPTFAVPHQGRPDVSVHRDTRSELASVNLSEAVATAQAQADGPDGLPATWCGDETTTDGTANAASLPATPQFKIVYAYAADRPNRFAGFRDALQADVAITERFLSAQSGGTRAIRFDMGTGCGAEYADLQVVALPGSRADYAGDFGAITAAVDRAVDTSAGPRNIVILADSLSPADVEYGLGETIMGTAGEQPGAQNPHNRGGLHSVLFTRDGSAEPGAARGGWWPEGFLHEITHNLGAVQWGASHPMQTDCAPIPGTITQGYDCGRDDYFNPAPAADSYLGTHWNTYDSVFMAPCVGIAPACGGGELWVPALNTDGTTASTSAPTAPVGAVAISRATSSRHARRRAKVGA